MTLPDPRYSVEQVADMVGRGVLPQPFASITDAASLDAVLSATDNDGVIVAQPANVALRQFCIARADDLGLTARLPEAWGRDGVITNATNVNDAARSGASPARTVERAYVLDDISIRADGTGRTVIAYCAPFGVEAEIHDQDGHYFESLARTSFDKTVRERAGQISCFYNHGRTIFGTPSDLFSVPIGTPKDIRVDARGVLTETLYGRSTIANNILDLINDGAPMGMSFSGRFMPGRSQRTRGDNGIDKIVRQEVAMNEYGPTPTPAYREAAILGTRSSSLLVTEIAETVVGLPDGARGELVRILGTSRSDTPIVVHTTVVNGSDTLETAIPVIDAAQTGTSVANDTPPTGAPVGSMHQRQRRARALALAPKGQTP